MKWTTEKPVKQGRYWWKAHPGEPPKLVFVKSECLGMHVVGVGWAKYQAGAWAGPGGEDHLEP
jgi:hypothetical protein